MFFSIIYGMSSFPLTFIFFRGVGQPPTREYLKWEAPSTQDINAYQNQDIVGIAENQIRTPKKQLVGEGAPGHCRVVHPVRDTDCSTLI
jgi:hypothetical protein